MVHDPLTVFLELVYDLFLVEVAFAFRTSVDGLFVKEHAVTSVYDYE
jgi:hypothetical protein